MRSVRRKWFCFINPKYVKEIRWNLENEKLEDEFLHLWILNFDHVFCANFGFGLVICVNFDFRLCNLYKFGFHPYNLPRQHPMNTSQWSSQQILTPSAFLSDMTTLRTKTLVIWNYRGKMRDFFLQGLKFKFANFTRLKAQFTLLYIWEKVVNNN
jgi:hypothetical protein